MRKRILTRTTKQYIIVALISLLVIGGAFLVTYFTTMSQIRSTYQLQIDKLNSEIEENKRTIYIATQEILAGDHIKEGSLQLTTVYSNLPQNYFVTKEDIGKIALINIPLNSHILKGMITNEYIDDELREEEFNMFYLSGNLKENDFVDIRLIYPNGEDYVVLSKKATKNLSLENNRCYMWLNTEELLTISGAIVDAFINEGAKLYTVKYIEPNIQEGSKVTYIPSNDVIKLIQNDENIVKSAARSLSKRLRQDLETRLNEFEILNNGTINWNQNNNTSTNNTNDSTYSNSKTESETVDTETYQVEEDGVDYVE